MRLALLGVLLIVAGIASRIVATRHVPGRALLHVGWWCVGQCAYVRTGWPPTTYDIARLASWTLLVFGAVVVAFAVVRELGKAR